MITREELHRLVDSLPDEAMETAQRMLTKFQVWSPPRPAMPPEFERFREEVKQRQKEATEGKRGIFGMMSGGGFDPKHGSGSMGSTYWEEETLQGLVMYVGREGSKSVEASSEEALKLVTQRVGQAERRVITGNASMKDFLDFIALRPPLLGRSENDAVLDRTGLKGLYAFNLVYVVPPMAPVSGEGGQRGGGRPGVGATSPAFSNMRDALQEQLGLRLESARIPTDIPVIEYVDKPSEN